jgi:hypothetical protein
MTRTLVADAVMSACAHDVSGRHGAVSESPEHPASAPAQPVSSRSVVRVCPLGVLGRPLPRECTGVPRPSCPRRPGPVHPLYLYLLQRRAATYNRWSFDPGRDI